MSLDWKDGVVEVAIGDRVFGVKGWCRGSYGVIALPGDDGGCAVFYLIERLSRRALSPFATLPLASIAGEIAEEVIAELDPSDHPGPVVHRAWRSAGFHHTDCRTRYGDPVWGWSEFAH